MSQRIANFTLPNIFYNVTGKEAEKLLIKHGIEGEFLVRPSSSGENAYSLSIHRGSRITHVKLNKNGDFFSVKDCDIFTSVTELINYCIANVGYLKEHNGDIIILTRPLSWNVRKYDWNYFHPNITGLEAEKFLKEYSKKGLFLVRQSQSHPTDLAMSVMLGEGKVCHLKIIVLSDTYDIGGGERFPSMDRLIEHHRKVPLIMDKGNVLRLETGLATTKIFIPDIDMRIEQLTKTDRNGKTLLSSEFDRLQASESQRVMYTSQKYGKKDENLDKNRYKNIVPYDLSRVKLKNEGTIEMNDYINGNYIEILSYEFPDLACINKHYISTQGCLPNTINDFWEMVWQEESHIIVMVTKEIERMKIKCTRYWPENNKVLTTGRYNDIEVYLEEKIDMKYFIIRILEVYKYKVVNNIGDKTIKIGKRTIYHFQYIGWPDHGCPKDPYEIVTFLKIVNEYSYNKCPVDQGPMIVHCSAGIGRTGTIIAIDIITEYIRVQGLRCFIDVLTSVKMVRAQRSGMVQTELQYKFVYDVVAAFIRDRIREYEINRQKNDIKILNPTTPNSANTISLTSSNSGSPKNNHSQEIYGNSKSPQLSKFEFSGYNTNSNNDFQEIIQMHDDDHRNYTPSQRSPKDLINIESSKNMYINPLGERLTITQNNLTHQSPFEVNNISHEGNLIMPEKVKLQPPPLPKRKNPPKESI
ncbi:Tyrosine-protein phosphatase non-receptor type 6 [Strongyloides ratti]|uniref:protein-tyrosine-phosphatase n=1 Tax=Strongyloides ratti TaxID=34506 RepID=A0A090KPI9_STRRB|nr:Tyrosine-protein phosphatase non-receptor type 6 [Strongyloides ratti]CEF59274.1 Tyrosine-protein phosphatase non-receptor type 6 [Strongyloides ratti]